MRVIVVSMEQRRNERAREMDIPEKTRNGLSTEGVSGCQWASTLLRHDDHNAAVVELPWNIPATNGFLQPLQCVELQDVFQVAPLAFLGLHFPVHPRSVKGCEYGAAPECKGGGKREIPQENPPTSGIVPHDSHMRKSGGNPDGNRIRFALVGGEYSDHNTTASSNPGQLSRSLSVGCVKLMLAFNNQVL
ncbi:hypothetical protein PR048_026412 [Dryococelus australis]|uniref:Uncharacterized protein n=1 Tax=Dryococelus australis TaxID=614101 RepID=A0ABQ9GL91_9NEOP|nr:hypothetical protein PR048_026412 [Dryococelus australis]